MLTTFSRFSQDASYPYGSGGPNGSFSLMTSHHMKKCGTQREDFGRICVAQRANALQYPGALMKSPLTLEQYMEARLIADPIVLFDCVMPTRNARNGMLFTTEGIVSIRNAKWKTCFEPIDPGLDHYAAQTFTKAYLRHLVIANEPLFMEIASIQNLAFYLWLMGEMRMAIAEGRFASWRNEWTERVSGRL